MTGYEVDEAEEMVAKVISVLDSPEHFKEQTTNVLEEVRIEGHTEEDMDCSLTVLPPSSFPPSLSPRYPPSLPPSFLVYQR